jgi:hypothetical protein
MIMTPGWSILFFGVHLLGIRALTFLDKNERFRRMTLHLTLLPLLAGAWDTIENLIILHVLTNPATYPRMLVPVMFVFVLLKFGMLFTSMILGGIANIMAFFWVLKNAKQKRDNANALHSPLKIE